MSQIIIKSSDADRIHIKVISWIRIQIRINLQIMEYEPIEAVFQGFEPL